MRSSVRSGTRRGLASTFICLVATTGLLLPISQTRAGGVVNQCTEADLRAALTGGGTIRLTNSTFSANRSLGGDANCYHGSTASTGGRGEGGAVLSGGDCVMVNCTLSGNVAQGGPGFGFGGNALGGGIAQTGGSLMLVHATVAANAAVGGDFGTYTNGTPGQSLGGGLFGSGATLRNSILANSTSGGNWSGSGLVDGGNNLSSDATSAFTSPGSRNITDHRLGPLGDYGGPTPTIPLLAGSPALDAANPAYAPATDQRGRARSFGSASDVGAFESCPPYTIRGTFLGYGEDPTLVLMPGSGPHGGCILTSNTYCWYGLLTASYLVAYTAQDTVFAHLTREFTLGPDVVGADFKGYQINALTPEVQANGLRLVYAGQQGQTIRWFRSTSLPTWQPAQTNTLGTNRLAEYFEIGTPAARFYQVVSP